MFQTINPATGEVVHNYEYHSMNDVKAGLLKAQKAFAGWKQTPLSQRSQALKTLATRLREHRAELAQLMTLEMGKDPKEGIAEIEKCATTCDYFAEQGPGFLQTKSVSSHYAQSEVHLEPLGVILSIMPWNFPFWQFIRFAAPSLMVGNTILLKHAELTTGCAEKIEELCQGLFSEPLVQTLRISHEMAATLIQDPLIRGVTFTGSTRGGREVAKAAGMALKKTVLELGGSDAYLIFPDAELALAAKQCAAVRMTNRGQSCVAGKRFIAVAEVYGKFTELFVQEMSRFPVALLASEKFQKQLQTQVDHLKALGGKVLCGGSLPSGKGAFYPPTVVTFEKNHEDLHKDEIFGPVAIVLKADSVDQAFEFANSSVYGLGGGIFSKDEKKAMELAAKKFEAGTVIVNDFVRSEAGLPFGGVKDSGYGRELSVFGLHEFCNIKSVSRGPSH